MAVEDASVDHPVLQACRDLAEAVNLFDDSVCATLRIGRSDLRALNLLGAGPLTATALSRRLGLTRPAVTALVDRLVAGGFVERVAVPGDRRATAVAAQPAAAAAFARVYGPLAKRVGAAVHGLPPQEQGALGLALSALTEAFREAGTPLAAGAADPASPTHDPARPHSSAPAPAHPGWDR